MSIIIPSLAEIAKIHQVCFSAYNNTTQANITGTDQVEFNTEDFDTNNDYDNSTFRFTPSIAGKYKVHARIKWTSLVSGDSVVILFRKNGSLYSHEITVVSVASYGQNLSDIIDFNGVDDYLEVFAENLNRDTSDLFSGGARDTAFMAETV